jgi:hypothetical protein
MVGAFFGFILLFYVGLLGKEFLDSLFHFELERALGFGLLGLFNILLLVPFNKSRG